MAIGVAIGGKAIRVDPITVVAIGLLVVLVLQFMCQKTTDYTY